MDDLTDPELIACLVAVTRELDRIEHRLATGDAMADSFANRLGEYRLDLSQAESRLTEALEARRSATPSLRGPEDYLQHYPQVD